MSHVESEVMGSDDSTIKKILNLSRFFFFKKRNVIKYVSCFSIGIFSIMKTSLCFNIINLIFRMKTADIYREHIMIAIVTKLQLRGLC